MADNYDVTRWIGVTDLGAENSNDVNSWYTIDNLPYIYSNWNSNEPSNSNGNEDCAHIYTSGGLKYLWNDNQCTKSFGFVCKKNRKYFLVSIYLNICYHFYLSSS